MSRIHYDFVEIGTSDFNTLIKTAGPDTVGLSVEPIGEYLDRLPNKSGVTKVNAAVSDKSGEIEIFYIPDSVRKQHKLPSWMKGTNSVGSPHLTVVKYLKKHGLPSDLVVSKIVPMISVEELFAANNIDTVDYLKIDTEGHDAVILEAYIKMVEYIPWLKAKEIRFESNSLTPKETIRELNEKLKALGYSVVSGKQDTVATLL